MDIIKNLKKVFLFSSIMIFVFMFAAVSMGGSGSSSNTTVVAQNLSASVEKYRKTVTEKAEGYGMSDYVELILCVMQVESNGEGLDPMQSSEGPYNKKYPKTPNGIQDPIYSIECGIQELKSVLEKANVKGSDDIEKIKVALAGYNFGSGYIDWINMRGGKWSLESAQEFSRMMAQQMGWNVYGDPPYVNKVMRYYQQEDMVISGDGDFIPPLKEYQITSRFGAREFDFHYGFDISSSYGAGIYAPSDASVFAASSSCPPDGGYLGNRCPFETFYGAGNYVMLKTEYKGDDYYILLCHMKTVNVSTGQKVKKGQKIGEQGNSGNSTGSHVHIEIHKNTTAIGSSAGVIDPADLIDF